MSDTNPPLGLSQSSGIAPVLLHSDDGPFLLASSREEAERWLRNDGAWGDGATVTHIGWFHDVGWDRETYNLKREFVQATGYDSWWESCPAPADGLQTRKRRRAFAIEAAE